MVVSRPKEKYLVDLFCCQQINGLFKKVWWLDTSWSIIQGLVELRRKKRVEPLKKFCSDILLRNVTTKFPIKFTCRTKIASIKRERILLSLGNCNKIILVGNIKLSNWLKSWLNPFPAHVLNHLVGKNDYKCTPL